MALFTQSLNKINQSCVKMIDDENFLSAASYLFIPSLSASAVKYYCK